MNITLSNHEFRVDGFTLSLTEPCLVEKCVVEIEDNITVSKAGKYEAEIITGAKINIEKGFSMPPVRNKSIPSCKVSNSKYKKALLLLIVLFFLSST